MSNAVDDGEGGPADDSRSLRAELTCLVIGPIGNKFAELGTPERRTYEEALAVLSEVIEPACAQVGLNPVRADSIAQPGEITEQVFRRLRDDDVVIADLSGANANVMYELGLRHTRDKLTIQVGEYSRLPFDLNVIRTAQFSRSEMGLINARNDLIALLEAGLAGQYDPVTATRLWQPPDDSDPSTNEGRAAGDGPPAGGDPPSGGNQVGASPSTDDDGDDGPGFLDVLEAGEDAQAEVTEALESLSGRMEKLAELTQGAAAETQEADRTGKGAKGALQVAAKYAVGLSKLAVEFEHDVKRYTAALSNVSDATLARIALLEADPSGLENEDALRMALAIRHMAKVTRASMLGLGELVGSVRENARLARVLREPSKRLATTLSEMTAATSVIDEWDRRLQALGVPVT